MDEVMQKARELAEAIRRSDLYLKSREAERAAYADADTVKAVSAYYGSEQAVKAILDKPEAMDAAALGQAYDRLEQSRTVMNAMPLVREMLEANKACNEMINEVSRILS